MYSTDELRAAALDLLKSQGNNFKRRDRKSQIYDLECGESFRLRTTNDRTLACKAEDPELVGKLDIEGVDRLLLAMPSERRRQSLIEVYWLDIALVVDTIKSCHLTWLHSIGKSKGDNTTPALYFDAGMIPTSDDYGSKWKSFRIDSRNC